MTNELIEPISRARAVERHDCRIPSAWVRAAEPVAPPPVGHWLVHGDEARLLEGAGSGPVLVMLGSASSPAVAALEAHGSSGARTYVLAPKGWRPGGALLRCPRVLVRRVAEVPVSAVLGPGGAAIWMGASAGGRAPWWLRLCDEQAAALRQVFLRLFWHEAVDEAFTGGERSEFRAAAERPFDVPELPSGAVVRRLEPGTALGASRAGQRVLLSRGALPSGTMQRLWVPPAGAGHGPLERLVRGGAAVVWDDRDLPELATDGRSGQVLLPGARGRLRLELSQAQAAEVAALLDASTTWSFRLDVRLGDHASDDAKLWLEGAADPGLVVPEQIIDLPHVQARELRDMKEAAPSQWPDPHPLSATVRYRWVVLPPRAPARAKEDALIVNWRKLDVDWSSRLEALEQALSAAHEHRGRVSKAFARFVGAFIGFAREHDELVAAAHALASRQPSASGPAEATMMLRRLAELETRTGRLRSEQDEEEHKARELKAHEEQQAEWSARVDAAKKAIPGKQAELGDAERRRTAVADELGEVDEALKSADKKTRKDLKARHHKLGDELARLDRELQSRRSELVRCEREAVEEFTFIPPARPKSPGKASSGRFVPAETAGVTTLVVPEEALPEVGSLRSLEGKRYLVIDTWQQLELGERAAQRLHAQLVAPEDS